MPVLYSGLQAGAAGSDQAAFEAFDHEMIREY